MNNKLIGLHLHLIDVLMIDSTVNATVAILNGWHHKRLYIVKQGAQLG